MQFYGSKIVSALILLNTTICLAMPKNGRYEQYQIGIASVTCDNRVYDNRRIHSALLEGLQNIMLTDETNKGLDEIRYKPQPTEVMPSTEKFYLNGIQRLRRDHLTDYVVYSSSGLLAKVVSRVPDSEGFKFIDCVASPTTPFPQQLKLIREIPGQSSQRHDQFGIGPITSVSCEGRVYYKRQIVKAIKKGLIKTAQLKRTPKTPDFLRYRPKPTEVMPSSREKFYYSELQKPSPDEPVDLVIFSRSGQFAKAVMQKEDGDKPYYVDCVSSSNRQFPEQSSSRMVSAEQPQLRMGSPVPPQLRMESSKRRRLSMKSPEQQSSE